MLYEVVNRRYERKPLIVTTNRAFKEWHEVFPNATCIVTLLDRLLERAVPLALVESALLLASLRRLIRPAGLPPLSPIRSLAYFEPVIAELQQAPLPADYTEYLRHKLGRVFAGLPAPSPEKDVS